MSRRGENIYKRKDNRWEGRYIKGYDCSGKANFGYVYAKSYKEVREKLSKAKQTQDKPINTTRKNFGSFCDEWLTLSRNRVKESTYVKYHNTVTRHIKPSFGDRLPQSLNTVTIENFSNGLLQDGLSPKTVKDILVVLRAILKYCRSQSDFFMPPVEVIYPKESKKEMRVLSLDEQNRFTKYLLDGMDNSKFGVLLAMLTGMRIGELCALRWENISFEQKCLYINSTMQRLQVLDGTVGEKTKISVGDAKSETSNRIIPLSEHALSLCRLMYKNCPQAFVLTGDTQRYLEPRLLQYRFKKYTDECNLKDVHFHSLRHTFATRCVEVGFEIKSLSEILGHASTKVTLDRYVHSSLELKRINMEKLSAVGL